MRPASSVQVRRVPAGSKYPLGHVQGKLRHRFDRGVCLYAVQNQPEVGCPAVELNGLVFPGNPALIEVRCPAGFQLAGEGDAAVLGDDGSLLRVPC